MKYVSILSMILLFPAGIFAQSYALTNGKWLMDGRFKKATWYTVNGHFTAKAPAQIDSTIDLKGGYCIPPFGDAHTHNLNGSYGLNDMINRYLKDGVFYVQVLGNHGEGSKAARPVLEKSKKVDVTYANGLLTSTYGHGFYPYEPLAMGIYAPYLQLRYEDSIKKSRLVENNAYYFLDSKTDVDQKWPMIMKYKPDHIKICLNDAENYPEKRRKEIADDNGLSPEVAAYVVQKAHAEGLRVFAHIETANDARLCAKIGVDVLAHLPGYYWNGMEETKNKYCMTKEDARLFKQSNLAVIPTINIEGTTKFDTSGNPIRHPDRLAKKRNYDRQTLRALMNAKVTIGIGADYFGKTVEPEIDTLISYRMFSNKELVMLYSKTTPQLIFPNRKIGEIKEGYEASFLMLGEDPFVNILAIKNILIRMKNGRFFRFA